VRQWIIIGAVALAAVLAAGPALADDASSPATNGTGAPALVIGGPTSPGALPADDGAFDDSFLQSLTRYLSQGRFTLGVNPGSNPDVGAPGSATNTYAELGLGGFSLGGRYTHWLENDPTHPNSQSFGLGAAYNLDSWTIGLDWTRGNYDEVFLDIGDSSGSADVYAFTTSYALRPGVRINGLLEYSDTKSGSSGSDTGGLAVGIGTLINF